MRKFAIPAGLPPASRTTVPKIPEAGVGNADEIAAGLRKRNADSAPKSRGGRGHFQPADEFQRAELRLVAADVEIGDRPRG